MRKNKFLALLLALIMLFSVSVFAEEPVKTPEEQQAEVEEYSNYMQKKIVQVYAHSIADNYYYGIDDEELLFAVVCNLIDEGKFNINSVIKAMIGALKDEHAAFYTPEEYKLMTEDVAGEFSGIGVTITENSNGVLVLSVIEGGPAYKAGILANDYIIGVNGQSTEGLSSAKVREMVVGSIGTEVKVKVRRGKDEIEFTCIRDTVVVSQIESEMIDKDTAYIKLDQFTSNSPEEMKTLVKDLQSKFVDNVILDLRDNPGGDLNAAIGIANVFISAGKIAELRYKDETKNEFIYSENFHAPNFDLVVLVNENSASASEFLAMAIQSRGAGDIIGTKTYGKGSMQVLNRAINGAGFKYTVGEFYTYTGKRIHTVGVTPDVYVENLEIKVNEEEFVPIDVTKLSEEKLDGNMVMALEQRLVAVGLMKEADEVFDDTTKDAVSRLQATLGYDITGIPGVGEFMFLNDYDYSQLDQVIDLQMEAAIKHFR